MGKILKPFEKVIVFALLFAVWFVFLASIAWQRATQG